MTLADIITLKMNENIISKGVNVWFYSLISFPFFQSFSYPDTFVLLYSFHFWYSLQWKCMWKSKKRLTDQNNSDSVPLAQNHVPVFLIFLISSLQNWKHSAHFLRHEKSFWQPQSFILVETLTKSCDRSVVLRVCRPHLSIDIHFRKCLKIQPDRSYPVFSWARPKRCDWVHSQLSIQIRYNGEIVSIINDEKCNMHS